MCRSCTRDEGRPFGVGFQERAPNHSKLLRSKAVVVSIGVKALRIHLKQVGIRESLFVSFTPAVSLAALKAMRQRTRRLNYRNRTDLSLPDIARLHNPILRGWLEYYGRFCPSALYPVFRHFNKTLVAWAMRKYRRFKGHKVRASLFLEDIPKRRPQLFVHRKRGMVGAFA
jgi:RNA-directed DNA polymerase